MRLNSFTDFGFRALMRMASAPESPFSTSDLARELGLSRHHLTKIMQRLARGGIVETRRGAGGGAILARAPQDIRLGEIVRLLEERTALVDCFRSGGGDCTLDGSCRLKGKLRMAEGAFLAELDRSTLADIALPVSAMAYGRERAVGRRLS
jgi:Rrf2 family transcriptional regulator, nitric oxide-sensitive transcriptional repressor